jgi:hypothetical protein
MALDQINVQGPDIDGEEELSPIDEILAYVANTPYNTNPNILRQMLVTLQNSEKNSQ